MTNQLDFTQFNSTNIVKKISKSKSNENIQNIDKQSPPPAVSENNEATNNKRGRKSKYNNDEERKEARRKQQREYRLRKKQELENLKNIVATQAQEQS